MKTYRGIRDPDCRVLVLNGTTDAPAEPAPLSVPAELLSKPPGPFDWGGGAETPGTHYLSIAILADLLGSSDRAGIKALLPFLRRFLARLPQEGFEISDTIFFALFSAIATGSRAESAHPPGHRPSLDQPCNPIANDRGERRTIT